MNLDKPAEKVYTGPNLARIVSELRDDGDRSLGASFCKRFGTDECPFGSTCPTIGYCGDFLFRESKPTVAVEIIQRDAEQHRQQAA